MFSVRYGARIQLMFWTCFSRATLVGVGVVILLLLVQSFEWTYKKCAICGLTSAFYLLMKTFGVLVKIVTYLSRITSNSSLTQFFAFSSLLYTTVQSHRDMRNGQ